MMVSGTYWPPYGPKRPRATADGLLGAMVIAADCLHKCSDESWIFATTREFDAAADIHPIRGQRAKGTCDIVGPQAASHETLGPDRPQCGPIKAAASPARQRVGVRIEEIAVRAEGVRGNHLGRGDLLA